MYLYDVTILAPMKRGLKATIRGRSRIETSCYNPCPDEKGTERILMQPTENDVKGYNPCPDEKGTER